MINSLRIFIFLLFLAFSISLKAQETESATDAVKNMAIGWNLGNTLDATVNDTTNIWTEWSTHNDVTYETSWGQPQATRELIHMLKEAGFKTIRVPVTWFPHMGMKTQTVTINGKYYKYWYMSKWQPTAVEDSWMARVKEVVDYVIDEGMYCILNVHHDTGAHNVAWIEASASSYNKYKETFENLWTQIATTFKDYDQHLLFEGYNEMIDKYDSWCFASMNSASKYSSTDATEAYTAINNYAQSFVNAVRATGGNNTTRNLIVNTYAACSGEGTWNTHLTDPLSQFKVPSDSATSGHLAVEIHAYPSIKSGLATAKSNVSTMMSRLKSYIVTNKKVPLIIGEWGTANDGATSDDYFDSKSNKIAITKYFQQQAKNYGFATVYWMGIVDKTDRTSLAWTQPEVKDAIVTGYYGDQGYDPSAIDHILADPATKSSTPYTITGQKVTPDYKGIIILDGKKHINY